MFHGVETDRPSASLAVIGVLAAILVLLASALTNCAMAQAGAGGPVPNVVGSQYLSTPNSVPDKQLVPFRVAPDGSLYTTSGSTTPVITAPQTGTGGQNAVTVTNVSGQILALRTAPQYALSIKNESTTASIAFCFGTSCTAALNTAGSITLSPGQLYSESATFIHLDRINGISSAATSPATIQAN